jgi:hypothetical protein
MIIIDDLKLFVLTGRRLHMTGLCFTSFSLVKLMSLQHARHSFAAGVWINSVGCCKNRLVDVNLSLRSRCACAERKLIIARCY